MDMLFLADLPPVRDLDGHIVRRVRVTKDEYTCLQCGEIALRARDPLGNPVTYCPRCTDGEASNSLEQHEVRRNSALYLVPTLSYLREGEWEG